jgi:hypothetical protein
MAFKVSRRQAASREAVLASLLHHGGAWRESQRPSDWAELGIRGIDVATGENGFTMRLVGLLETASYWPSMSGIIRETPDGTSTLEARIGVSTPRLIRQWRYGCTIFLVVALLVLDARVLIWLPVLGCYGHIGYEAYRDWRVRDPSEARVQVLIARLDAALLALDQSTAATRSRSNA